MTPKRANKIKALIFKVIVNSLISLLSEAMSKKNRMVLAVDDEGEDREVRGSASNLTHHDNEMKKK
ncbi:hypothetical protein Syun_016026 [Stephania yunnanensis]|uniref:Uncharacterized protein n=1 Tax=Stephania yunnanensis TaxID=152371 RepID=A0AAP0J4A2_9MAGN